MIKFPDSVDSISKLPILSQGTRSCPGIELLQWIWEKIEVEYEKLCFLEIMQETHVSGFKERVSNKKQETE